MAAHTHDASLGKQRQANLKSPDSTVLANAKAFWPCERPCLKEKGVWTGQCRRKMETRSPQHPKLHDAMSN